jgi:hypothetical protein
MGIEKLGGRTLAKWGENGENTNRNGVLLASMDLMLNCGMG